MKRGRFLGTFRYFRDQRGSIVRLGVVALVSAQFQAVSLIIIVPLAKAIADNQSSYSGRLGPVSLTAGAGELAGLAALAVVVAAILDLWIAWERARVMAQWEFGVREHVISKYLTADYPTQTLERQGTLGTLTTYVNRGSSALGSLVNALEAVITISLFVVGAVILDYRAAVAMLAAVAVLTVVLRPLMVRTKRYSRASSKLLVDYGRDVTEATGTVRDARVFDALGPLGAQLTDTSRQAAALRKRSAFVSGAATPTYQYLGLLLIVGALAAAAALKSLDLAVFGGVMLLLLRSLTFGQQLQVAYQNIVDSIPYVDRLDEALTTYSAHQTRDGSLTLEAVHSLELDDVGYSYGGDVEALTGISVAFNVGEIVGVVGPSGSGKSTLSQLILRLREPTRGVVTVNRTPANDYTLASWYRHVSLVPQDPHLIHATVHDNIAFLDETISREDVENAARAANVAGVIETLEQGYDTLIGPALHDLSGGQIQRIGIARALARGAQVLVLDEPTSALDLHSEAVIQTTLESLRGHALVMIIAHRLSTLSICDRVLVLRDGEIEALAPLADISSRSDFFRRALDAGTLEVEPDRQHLPADG